MPRQAKPKPVYRASLYRSFIPLFITAPMMLPTMIVQVFTIVPNILPIFYTTKIGNFWGFGLYWDKNRNFLCTFEVK